jgi:hypothetical protein
LAVEYFFVALYPLLPIRHYQLPLLSKPEGLDSRWGQGATERLLEFLGRVVIISKPEGLDSISGLDVIWGPGWGVKSVAKSLIIFHPSFVPWRGQPR